MKGGANGEPGMPDFTNSPGMPDPRYMTNTNRRMGKRYENNMRNADVYRRQKEIQNEMEKLGPFFPQGTIFPKNSEEKRKYIRAAIKAKEEYNTRKVLENTDNQYRRMKKVRTEFTQKYGVRNN
jgi:hypothetical protein